MDILAQHLVTYIEALTSPESELLSTLNRDTHAHVLSPRMLSGHYQGRLLSLLSRLQKPNYILEIGTYTGYSALCLAEGLPAGGELHTIELNEELEDRILDYFQKSEYKDQVHLHIGNARTIIPTLNIDFQLVFIDADKLSYATYFDMALQKMTSGGLIIIDNVLWKAKVYEQVENPDKKTKYLQEFNQKVHDDPRVDNILLPVRDGLMLAFVK